MAKPPKPPIPELLTLHGRVLLAIHRSADPITYKEYGKLLDVHPRSVQRVADDMIAAGWLTAERKSRCIAFTINDEAETLDGGTIGSWLR